MTGQVSDETDNRGGYCLWNYGAEIESYPERDRGQQTSVPDNGAKNQKACVYYNYHDLQAQMKCWLSPQIGQCRGLKNKAAIALQCKSNFKLIAALFFIPYSSLIRGDSWNVSINRTKSVHTQTQFHESIYQAKGCCKAIKNCRKFQITNGENWFCYTMNVLH